LPRSCGESAEEALSTPRRGSLRLKRHMLADTRSRSSNPDASLPQQDSVDHGRKRPGKYPSPVAVVRIPASRGESTSLRTKWSAETDREGKSQGSSASIRNPYRGSSILGKCHWGWRSEFFGRGVAPTEWATTAKGRASSDGTH